MTKNGRINLSLCQWCYEDYWNLEEMCELAKELGCRSIELVDVKEWPVLKKHGLVCALHMSHWFDEGMNNPKHQPMCIEKMRTAIDECVEFGFNNVITFTGFTDGISQEDGLKNCVDGYKKIVGYAEEKGINLCLEMLNTRVDIEMRGHPGYQGDHTDYVMEIINAVGSPRLQLLFDIYHVQVMDGDVITRIREYGDSVAHYHVAGCPGRGPLDDNQEIQFKPIMEAIIETGYSGHFGIEFLSEGKPLEELQQAVSVCGI